LQSIPIEKNKESISESSAEIRKRAIAACESQHKKYGLEICDGRAAYKPLSKTNNFLEKVK